MVDIICDLLKEVTDGVVRYRRHMYDNLPAAQCLLAEPLNILEKLHILSSLGEDACIRQAMRKVAGIKPHQDCAGVRLPQALHDTRPNITHVSCDQYFHRSRSLIRISTLTDRQ